MSAPSLRPYQVQQLEAICTALDAGTNRVLVNSPTGTGKTVTFAQMLRFPQLAQWLAQLGPGKGARLLVIAHREELLDQAAEKIGRANPGLMISIEQGDRHANRYSDVVIASIQTLAAMQFRRLERLLARHDFRIVIVDEAHHAAAATYRTALVRLGFLPAAEASATASLDAVDYDDVVTMEAALRGWDAVAPKDRLLVGFTATPNRSDAIGLGCVFQSIAYSYGLKEAIADGWLVPIVPWVVETSSNLDAVKLSDGDFNQRELAETVNTAERNQLAVAAWHDYAESGPTLAFTVDVAHAHALASEFRLAGVRAQALSGETPRDERRTLLEQYRQGQIDVITNCMVLTEGTDLPLTRCILHTKPTKSATLYEQMTGRGLRLFAGKDHCVVIDVVDIARRHSLQAAPVLYGLPPGIKTAGESLESLEAAIAAMVEEHPMFDLQQALADGRRLTLGQLHATAVSFDVWSVPSLGAFAEVLRLNWIKIRGDEYRLVYPWADGTETLSVQKDMLGHYEIVTTFQPAIPSGPPYQNAQRYGNMHVPLPARRQRTLVAQIPEALAALTLAEAFVAQERGSVSRLRDREAKWRGRPASRKQLAALRRMRVPHNPATVTMGKASDLIDLAKSRRV
jgi:superfamily II DNA or RNA helicase